MNRSLHDDDHLRPARGIITSLGLAIVFFWLPLGATLLAILWSS
jgi:hypothetical protein